MNYVFTVVYDDDLIHNIDGIPQRCAKQMTVTETTLDGAIALVQSTLASDNKTLKSLTLQVIEV
jgi:hypothetical protein